MPDAVTILGEQGTATTGRDDLVAVKADDTELAKRRAAWTPPAARYARGVLSKFRRLSSSASKGAVLDSDE